MVATAARRDSHIQELTREEGRQLLDARAQHYLGISGEEFLRRWEQGQYRGEDRPEVLRVVMALPFVGR